MDKIAKIEKYLVEFFESRYNRYKNFYDSVYNNRREGIYNLDRGSDLMDFLNNIMGDIENKLYVEKLIPNNYISPEGFIYYLKEVKKYLIDGQKLLDINVSSNYYIIEISEIKNELIQMIDYVLLIFDRDDINIPYQELRYCLISKDLDSFFKYMGSILASVSYQITKIQEGYLHSNIHLILKLLGFDIDPEVSTNIGRIDAVIRFTNIIYIFEFKLGTSKEAIQQIRNKKYYQKYLIEKKEIILVGIGFNYKDRNINLDFIAENVEL